MATAIATPGSTRLGRMVGAGTVVPRGPNGRVARLQRDGANELALLAGRLRRTSSASVTGRGFGGGCGGFSAGSPDRLSAISRDLPPRTQRRCRMGRMVDNAGLGGCG